MNAARQGIPGLQAGEDVKSFQASLDLGLAEEPAGPDPTAGVALVDGLPQLAQVGEPKGVVYTRPWVVDLILDLAGYRPEDDLAAHYAVEPSVGNGAFLVPMVRRLMASLSAHGRDIGDAQPALRAYELDRDAAVRATGLVVQELRQHGIGKTQAQDLAQGWVGVGDYLLASPHDRRLTWSWAIPRTSGTTTFPPRPWRHIGASTRPWWAAVTSTWDS